MPIQKGDTSLEPVDLPYLTIDVFLDAYRQHGLRWIKFWNYDPDSHRANPVGALSYHAVATEPEIASKTTAYTFWAAERWCEQHGYYWSTAFLQGVVDGADGEPCVDDLGKWISNLASKDPERIEQYVFDYHYGRVMGYQIRHVVQGVK